MDRLTECLLDRGLVTAADLARAEEVRAHGDRRLAATLTRLGLVAEVDLASAFQTVAIVPSATRDDIAAGAIKLDGVNPRFLIRSAAAPLGVIDERLVVAMADPEDEAVVSALAFATGREIERRVATFTEVEEALGGSQRTDDEAVGGTELSAGAADDLERLLEGESAAPVIRLVQKLLAGAVMRRASDVHIEPQARSLIVRYRIDGRLIEVERHPDALAAPVASRVKVMAGLDIAESRLPQDGRLRLTVRGREVDVRVSTSPTAWGESIVMRLLGRNEVPLDLERLGLPASALATLYRALDRPHGIILLTGPTGSGKTTTLYAAVSRLRRPEVKILTVEDPVEVLLEGVNQVQVRPEIDLSYAAALRAFLRQDPDILMIGEIRDGETAEIALRAALTGHLVLSTLHTNSARGAFTRLADIGVEPYLVASTVIATIAQRLVRALCPTCRSARPIDAREAEQFTRAGMIAPPKMFDPVGCPDCQGTGFAGRIPLIEILEVDDELRQRIRDQRTDDAPDRRLPTETLLGHGLALVAEGRTSLGEIARAVTLA